MNVFVLCTGRCGSNTFTEACQHIRNFSCGHEARKHLIGSHRLEYPPFHIEVDNRLSWFLGKLEEHYGAEAYYVHLTRDEEETAASFEKRFDRGIMNAYAEAILQGNTPSDPIEICRDYCRTVNKNIQFFLRDKPHQMHFTLEHAKEDFRVFWDWIGAEGDFQKAVSEWDHRYNASDPDDLPQPPSPDEEEPSDPASPSPLHRLTSVFAQLR